MESTKLWQRYQRYLCPIQSLGIALDISRMRFEDRLFEQMGPALRDAFEAMDSLERGAIANPDEKRMVGHYWLRAPDLAPRPEIAAQIRATLADIKSFAAAVHTGEFQ
jgi:glucose-6-phosphate isomerase